MPTTRLLLVIALGLGCSRDGGNVATGVGDAARGRELAHSYGCHTCHDIPTLRAADANVGPPLTRLRLRVYAGGRLNTAENLIEFLVDPRGVDPRTPMPSVGLTERDARDVAAFLYSLE